MSTNRAQITFIMASFGATDTKAPKTLLEAQKRSEKITAAARAIGRDQESPSLAHAVSAALLAERDPYTDNGVLAATVAMQIQQTNIVDRVVTASLDAVGEAIVESADEIVEVWRKPFDEAAAVLSAAHERIGDKDLDDSAAILKLGGDIAEVWTQARQANLAISRIEDAWVMLSELSRRGRINLRYRVLRIADVPPARVLEEFDSKRLTPWEVVSKGLPLSLPTLDGADERDQSIARARVQAENDYRTQQTRAAGQSLRFSA